VVLAVAAATFVLSYAGVHAIALQGGVSVQLARIYPGLFDAVLVIACVAAVVLRDGRWWARCWAWLVVIVILGAIGATDVLHATNYALRHRPTEGVVAAAPVVGVLLAFSLLLTMLRQSRPPQASEPSPGPQGRAARRAARQSTAPAAATPIDATPIDAVPIDAVPINGVPVDAVPVVAAGAVPRPPAPPIALPPIALPPAPAAQAADEPEADAGQAPDESAAVAKTATVAQTQEIPVLADHASDVDEAGESREAAHDLPDPAAAPTREESWLSATAPATPDTELTPDVPTAPNIPMTPDVPTTPGDPETPGALEASDNPAAPHSPTASQEPSLQPTWTPRPGPQAIRYASSAASESASDYWDPDVDPALAGQVYPVLTSDPDIDTSGYHPDEPRDVDDTDAPPFATAPFASVPRLNRMRVTPIPPTDSDDGDQG
jgi:hypothetical protein